MSLRIGNSLDDAAEGLIAPQHIVSIVALKMLVSTKDLIPISLFLGVFSATTRIQNNFEWNAMRSAGFSQAMLITTIFKISLIAAVLVGFITLFLVPETELQLRHLKQETKNEATIGGVKPGRFTDFKHRSQIFFAERSSTDGKFLEKAFVQRDLDDSSDVLKADRAYIENQRSTGDRFAVFENGVSYNGVAGQLDFTKTEFGRYLIRIESKNVMNFPSQVGFLPSHSLLGSGDILHQIELQWRFAPIICTLLMPLAAALVALYRVNGGWHFGLIVVVSIYFTYINLLATGKTLMGRGVVSPEIGLWPIHLIPILFLMILISHHQRSVSFQLPSLLKAFKLKR